MNHKQIITFLILVACGILSRLIPHPPNFTALNALALLGPLYLGSFSVSLLMLSSVLFCGDLIFGFHTTMPSVYLSYLLVALGATLKHRLKISPYYYFIAASLLFYGLSNFGVWLSTDMYPRNIQGLYLCYLAALPFLKYQLLGDLFYGVFLLKVVNFISLPVPVPLPDNLNKNR